jgi:hypothetical protein
MADDDQQELETVWSGALERSGQAPGLSSFPARVTVPARGGAVSRQRAAGDVDDEEDA